MAIFEDAFKDLEESYQEDTPEVLSPLDALTLDELTDRKNYKSKSRIDNVDREQVKDETRVRRRMNIKTLSRYIKSEYTGRA